MSGGDRSRADLSLIASLAAGSTARVAARRARISEATVFRRLRDADFQRELAGARAHMLDRALGRLAGHAAEAVDALAALLRHREARVKLRASETLLRLLLEVRAHVELERRLIDLEEQFDANMDGRFR